MHVTDQAGRRYSFDAPEGLAPLNAEEAPPPADGKVQQKVEAGSLDGIGTNSFVSAWGERRGDRVIARVVVYTPARVIPAPDQ